MSVRYNPFRPDKIAKPGMFAGRIPELKTIDQCLLQTSFGNPQHFLIEGERGIGKSSILMCSAMVANGHIPTISDVTLNFVVLNVSLHERDTHFSIIRKIAGELRKELGKRDRAKSFVVTALDFISRFEAAGVRYNKASCAVDDIELLARLQDDLVNLIERLEEDVDGIFLLIDEADKAASDADLGLIVKHLTEELTRRNCDKLCIGLAGLPGLVSILRASHESSPRIFRVMNIDPLEYQERLQVIDTGIKIANEKNKSGEIKITDDARSFLAELSEGYPHFLQEYCYCAFERDSDGTINIDDVIKSLFDENGAFEQLGQKYFSQYYDAPSSDDYRIVLKTMASHLDECVSRSDIIGESGLKSTTVDNALRALKGKNTILQQDGRQGLYRLPTKSFAVWIKARIFAEQTAQAKQGGSDEKDDLFNNLDAGSKSLSQDSP